MATSDVIFAKETGPQLPVEIWATIFRKLNFNDWCNARSVNSRWKTIIDGDRSIMSKFIFKFPKVNFLNRFPPTLPASTIHLKNHSLRYVGSWWFPQITKNLTNLEFQNTALAKPHTIKLKVLLTLLRHTPNLVSLNLWSTFLDESVAEFSDLQLRKMEKLTLGSVKQDAVLEMFSRIFPRLKDFSLLNDYHKCCDGMLGMIKTGPSLEGISLVSSTQNFTRLVGVNHQFKRVSIKISDSGANFNKNLNSFLDKQPLLECFSLDVHIDSNIYSIVFKNMHRLKRLSVKLWSIDLFRPFREISINVGCSSELEHLTLSGGTYLRCQPFLAGVRHPKLKELFLINFMPSNLFTSDLQEYIMNAPNLHTITLDGYYCNKWSELFNAIPSKWLRRLELCKIHVYKHDKGSQSKCFDELLYLEIRECNLLENSLSTLFGLCPRLKELHLTDMKNVRDAVVLKVCQEMTQLRKLTISKCPITDASAKHIIEHGLNLEQLTIESCKKLTTEGATQLKQAQIATVEIM